MTGYFLLDVTLVTMIDAEDEEKAKTIGQQYAEDISKIITDNKVQVDSVEIKSYGYVDYDD